MNKFFTQFLSAMTLVVATAGSALAGPPINDGGPATSVPEPGTLLLLGAGAVGLILYKKINK